MLGVMRVMQIRWTRTWAEKGGRARAAGQSAQPMGKVPLSA
jgi:NNP family nitrate/nitrite transporter-like MFS transporter